MPQIKGGAARMVIALAKGLESSGVYSPVIITPQPDLILDELTALVNVKTVKGPPLQALYGEPYSSPALVHQYKESVVELSAIFRALDVDIVVSCTNTFTEGVLAAAQVGIPSVVWNQGFVSNAALHQSYRASQHILQRELLKAATENVFISHWTRNVAEALYGELSNSSVIHNWLPETEGPTQPTKPPRAQSIGFFGTFEPHKGFGDLLRAFESVIAVIPQAQLVVFSGSQFPEAISNQIAERGLSDHVQHRGYTSTPIDEMESLSVIAVPSLIENFGLVAAEAGKAGKPVIATDLGGLREVVIDGETGLLFPAGNYEQLAECILILLTNEALSDSLGSKARIHVEESFNETRQTAQFEKLFSRVLESEQSITVPAIFDYFGALAIDDVHAAMELERNRQLFEHQAEISLIRSFVHRPVVKVPSSGYLQYPLVSKLEYFIDEIQFQVVNSSQNMASLGLELVINDEIRFQEFVDTEPGFSTISLKTHGLYVPARQPMYVRVWAKEGKVIRLQRMARLWQKSNPVVLALRSSAMPDDVFDLRPMRSRPARFIIRMVRAILRRIRRAIQRLLK